MLWWIAAATLLCIVLNKLPAVLRNVLIVQPLSQLFRISRESHTFKLLLREVSWTCGTWFLVLNPVPPAHERFCLYVKFVVDETRTCQCFGIYFV